MQLALNATMAVGAAVTVASGAAPGILPTFSDFVLRASCLCAGCGAEAVQQINRKSSARALHAPDNGPAPAALSLAGLVRRRVGGWCRQRFPPFRAQGMHIS